jgi:hypothetical protein
VAPVLLAAALAAAAPGHAAVTLAPAYTDSAVALRGLLKQLGPGKLVVFQLRLSQRVRRTLAQRGAVAISLRGRDAAGNVRAATLTVRVQRR